MTGRPHHTLAPPHLAEPRGVVGALSQFAPSRSLCPTVRDKAPEKTPGEKQQVNIVQPNVLLQCFAFGFCGAGDGTQASSTLGKRSTPALHPQPSEWVLIRGEGKEAKHTVPLGLERKKLAGCGMSHIEGAGIFKQSYNPQASSVLVLLVHQLHVGSHV